MSPLKLRISAEASADLENIWLFTYQRWSLAQADKYYTQILQAIQFLRSHAKAGKSAENIRPGYRVYKVQSHLVFYRTHEENHLDIIRILHQSIDIETWLK